MYNTNLKKKNSKHLINNYTNTWRQVLVYILSYIWFKLPWVCLLKWVQQQHARCSCLWFCALTRVAEDQEAPVTPKEMVFETIKSDYISRTKKQGSIIKSHPLTINKMFTVKLMERNLPANNRNQNIFLWNNILLNPC